MELIKTGFTDLVLIKPDVFNDPRGYFFESYNQNALKKAGINITFIQDNQSLSSYGTIRGLHFQLVPFAQSKLIRVLHGRILDVVVDLRKDSSTFGQWYSAELSSENFLQLFIPQGFAHGFSVLSENALVFYKTDAFYNKEAERGIRYNDPQLKIDWKIPSANMLVSDKDKVLPYMHESEINFNR
jgi:dTDP-4-dehydrorhamnose 3,5-epimerase